MLTRPPAGALVTAAGPQMRAVMRELALPTFERYAARWGWSVQAHDLTTDGSGADAGAQHAKWTKIRLMRDALRSHQLALWVDADVLLLRDDDDIRRHLHPDHFQALALEHVPAEHRVNPNTGVWLMSSCPESVAFLDAVEAAGPQPGPWADQGAVLAALGWNRGDDRYHWAGPGAGSSHLTGTSWLPSSWNQPYSTGRRAVESFNSDAASYDDRPQVRRPHALHFMGMSPLSRYRAMHAAATLLAAAQRSATDTGAPQSEVALAAVSDG